MSLNHFEIANFLLSFMNPSLSLMLAPSARGQVFRLPDTSACQKSKSELWSKVSRCNHREISRILIQLNFTKFLKLFTISGQVHENRFGKAYHFSWKSAGWIEKSGSTNQWGFWEFRKLLDVSLGVQLFGHFSKIMMYPFGIICPPYTFHGFIKAFYAPQGAFFWKKWSNFLVWLTSAPSNYQIWCFFDFFLA